jgi:TolA-binding protein
MKTKFPRTVIFVCVGITKLSLAQATFTKAQVADRIRKVEDGVDQFRKWAENRAEQGQSAKNSGRTTGPRGRTATEPQKAQARKTKDDLEDALSELNRSTNRLRRKFDPADKWMETRPQVERVLDHPPPTRNWEAESGVPGQLWVW